MDYSHDWKTIKADGLVASLLWLMVHVHLYKTLGTAVCKPDEWLNRSNLAVPLELSNGFPCTASAWQKLHHLAPRPIVWRGVLSLWSHPGEFYVAVTFLSTIAWVLACAAAAASLARRNTPLPAFSLYMRGGRLAMICLTKLSHKVTMLAAVLLKRQGALQSSYFHRYMPVEGVVLLLQACATPVSPTAQAAITAADALCNFLCCWVLSDNWPYRGVSMGAILCSNLVLAYLSLLVSYWMDQRHSANPQPCPNAHVHARQPGATPDAEGQLHNEQLGALADGGVSHVSPRRGSEAEGQQEEQPLVGAEVEGMLSGGEAGRTGRTSTSGATVPEHVVGSTAPDEAHATPGPYLPPQLADPGCHGPARTGTVTCVHDPAPEEAANHTCITTAQGPTLAHRAQPSSTNTARTSLEQNAAACDSTSASTTTSTRPSRESASTSGSPSAVAGNAGLAGGNGGGTGAGNGSSSSTSASGRCVERISALKGVAPRSQQQASSSAGSATNRHYASGGHAASHLTAYGSSVGTGRSSNSTTTTTTTASATATTTASCNLLASTPGGRLSHHGSTSADTSTSTCARSNGVATSGSLSQWLTTSQTLTTTTTASQILTNTTLSYAGHAACTETGMEHTVSSGRKTGGEASPNPCPDATCPETAHVSSSAITATGVGAGSDSGKGRPEELPVEKAALSHRAHGTEDTVRQRLLASLLPLEPRGTEQVVLNVRRLGEVALRLPRASDPTCSGTGSTSDAMLRCGYGRQLPRRGSSVQSYLGASASGLVRAPSGTFYRTSRDSNHRVSLDAGQSYHPHPRVDQQQQQQERMPSQEQEQQQQQEEEQVCPLPPHLGQPRPHFTPNQMHLHHRDLSPHDSAGSSGSVPTHSSRSPHNAINNTLPLPSIDSCPHPTEAEPRSLARRPSPGPLHSTTTQEGEERACGLMLEPSGSSAAGALTATSSSCSGDHGALVSDRGGSARRSLAAPSGASPEAAGAAFLVERGHSHELPVAVHLRSSVHVLAMPPALSADYVGRRASCDPRAEQGRKQGQGQGQGQEQEQGQEQAQQQVLGREGEQGQAQGQLQEEGQGQLQGPVSTMGPGRKGESPSGPSASGAPSPMLASADVQLPAQPSASPQSATSPPPFLTDTEGSPCPRTIRAPLAGQAPGPLPITPDTFTAVPRQVGPAPPPIVPSTPNCFAVARQLVATGGVHASYTSPALIHMRCSIKVHNLRPADLPEHLPGQFGGAMVSAAPSLVAVGVYVREGCVELVADVLLPAGSSTSEALLAALEAAAAVGAAERRAGARALADGGPVVQQQQQQQARMVHHDAAWEGMQQHAGQDVSFPSSRLQLPQEQQQQGVHHQGTHQGRAQGQGQADPGRLGAAEAMLSFLERSLLPQLPLPLSNDGVHKVGLQAGGDTATVHVRSANGVRTAEGLGPVGSVGSVDAAYQLRGQLQPDAARDPAGAAGQQAAALAAARAAPPTVLCVTPCCVALDDGLRPAQMRQVLLQSAAFAAPGDAPFADDIRDNSGPGGGTAAADAPYRGPTVALEVVIAVPWVASVAALPPQPRIMLRQGGRCLAAAVTPLGPPVPCTAPAQQDLLPVFGQNAPGMAGIRGPAAAMTYVTSYTVHVPLDALRPGLLVLEAAAGDAPGGGGPLSLPWPVLVAADGAVAAEVGQLQQQLTAAATRRHGAPAWLPAGALDGGALPLLLDLGIWFESVSMPDPAIAAAAAAAAVAAAALGAASSGSMAGGGRLEEEQPEVVVEGVEQQEVSFSAARAAEGSAAGDSGAAVAAPAGSGSWRSEDGEHDAGDVAAQMALLASMHAEAHTSGPEVPLHGSARPPPPAEQPTQPAPRHLEPHQHPHLHPHSPLAPGSLDCTLQHEQLLRSSPVLQGATTSLGLRLLRFSISRGWASTSTLLLRGLLSHCGLTFRDVCAAFADVPGPGTGLPLLHTAVTSGRLATVRTAVAWGVRYRWALRWDEPAAAAAGLTPLHLAAALEDGGRMAGDVLGLWPEAEAAWGAVRDGDGCTPCDFACRRVLSDAAASAGSGRALLQQQHHVKQQQHAQAEAPAPAPAPAHSGQSAAAPAACALPTLDSGDHGSGAMTHGSVARLRAAALPAASSSFPGSASTLPGVNPTSSSSRSPFGLSPEAFASQRPYGLHRTSSATPMYPAGVQQVAGHAMGPASDAAGTVGTLSGSTLHSPLGMTGNGGSSDPGSEVELLGALGLGRMAALVGTQQGAGAAGGVGGSSVGVATTPAAAAAAGRLGAGVSASGGGGGGVQGWGSARYRAVVHQPSFEGASDCGSVSQGLEAGWSRSTNTTHGAYAFGLGTATATTASTANTMSDAAGVLSMPLYGSQAGTQPTSQHGPLQLLPISPDSQLQQPVCPHVHLQQQLQQQQLQQQQQAGFPCPQDRLAMAVASADLPDGPMLHPSSVSPPRTDQASGPGVTTTAAAGAQVVPGRTDSPVLGGRSDVMGGVEHGGQEQQQQQQQQPSPVTRRGVQLRLLDQLEEQQHALWLHRQQQQQRQQLQAQKLPLKQQHNHLRHAAAAAAAARRGSSSFGEHAPPEQQHPTLADGDVLAPRLAVPAGPGNNSNINSINTGADMASGGQGASKSLPLHLQPKPSPDPAADSNVPAALTAPPMAPAASSPPILPSGMTTATDGPNDSAQRLLLSGTTARCSVAGTGKAVATAAAAAAEAPTPRRLGRPAFTPAEAITASGHPEASSRSAVAGAPGEATVARSTVVRPAAVRERYSPGNGGGARRGVGSSHFRTSGGGTGAHVSITARRFAYADDYAPLCLPTVGAQAQALQGVISLGVEEGGQGGQSTTGRGSGGRVPAGPPGPGKRVVPVIGAHGEGEGQSGSVGDAEAGGDVRVEGREGQRDVREEEAGAHEAAGSAAAAAAAAAAEGDAEGACGVEGGQEGSGVWAVGVVGQEGGAGRAAVDAEAGRELGEEVSTEAGQEAPTATLQSQDPVGAAGTAALDAAVAAAPASSEPAPNTGEGAAPAAALTTTAAVGAGARAGAEAAGAPAAAGAVEGAAAQTPLPRWLLLLVCVLLGATLLLSVDVVACAVWWWQGERVVPSAWTAAGLVAAVAVQAWVARRLRGAAVGRRGNKRG